MRQAGDGRRVQDRVLMAKIRRNAESDYGREFGFRSIAGYDDFKRALPIQHYEDVQPYIERVKRGESTAMFSPSDKVLMFALTSGTTAEPKFIPVTKSFFEEYRSGWNAFGVKALLDHEGSFLRPILQVVSPKDAFHTEAGIPCGAITGLMADMQKALVRKYYVCPRDICYIENTTARYYACMRLGVPTNVSFLITASPATQLGLAKTVHQHADLLIRDIHDGTLTAEFEIAPAIRQTIQPKLSRRPDAAKRLERLVDEKGGLYPKDYWELGFLANWTGGSMGLYLREFDTYFGSTPIRDIGLLASEGRMSIPISDEQPAGVLEVTSNFYEFVPAEQWGDPSPDTLRSHELEVGREYFILLTTSSGLYRYDIGDQIRVVDFYHDTPLIEFLNKGEHVSSMAGEKVTENQVVLAFGQACKRNGCRIDTFVMAPAWGDPPHYVLHLENRDAGGERALSPLSEAFDGELSKVNIEYASKRKSGRLGRIQLNLLDRGVLTQMDRELRQQRRATKEQFKHRFLYTQPDAMADFLNGSSPLDPVAGQS
jgi:hypothetical protein